MAISFNEYVDSVLFHAAISELVPHAINFVYLRYSRYNMMIHEIYEIDDLQQLGGFLSSFSDTEMLRNELFSEFLGYCRYRNAVEWNKAVRLCECLAIVGWGDKEPLEAVRGLYFNGNPNTCFINREGRPRFMDAVWTKRKDGVAIDFSRSVDHMSPDRHDTTENIIGEMRNVALDSQRNWIAKNPILLTRGLANCYENSRPLIESMENELMPELNRLMRPELYGKAINRIVINCSFSFYDNYHCKTNYIIADETLRLRQKDYYSALLAMYSEKEIEDNGYYLRNRFTFGPFRADTGTSRIVIVFEKEFSEMPVDRQKKLICEYFLRAVGQFAKRIGKRVEYDFDLMIADFSDILCRWCPCP